MEITTIKLNKDTKKRLDKVREYKNESYDEIIGKILGLLSLCNIDPFKAKRILRQVAIKRVRIKNSKAYSEQELKEKFNL